MGGDQALGKLIRNARREKGWSQRKLAHHLNLDADDLHWLSGRIDPETFGLARELVKAYPLQMCALFRKMRDNPDFAQRLIQESTELESKSQVCPNCKITGWDKITGCGKCGLSPEDLM